VRRLTIVHLNDPTAPASDGINRRARAVRTGIRAAPASPSHRLTGREHSLYNASVYRDLKGNVLGVFAAARDVTAQMQAQAEIAAQQAEEPGRLAELEQFQRLAFGRELKMIELKKENESPRRYAPPDEDEPCYGR